jgi:hypothetical protein
MPDFRLLNAGTIAVLTPCSTAAEDWVDEYIDPDHQEWAGGVVIEHRFVLDILNGIDGVGLTVDVGGPR